MMPLLTAAHLVCDEHIPDLNHLLRVDTESAKGLFIANGTIKMLVHLSVTTPLTGQCNVSNYIY